VIQQHFTLRQTANQQSIGDDRHRIDRQVVADYDVLVASGHVLV